MLHQLVKLLILKNEMNTQIIILMISQLNGNLLLLLFKTIEATAISEEYPSNSILTVLYELSTMLFVYMWLHLEIRKKDHFISLLLFIF